MSGCATRFSRLKRTRLVFWLTFTLAAWVVCPQIVAATRVEKRQQAEELVREALFHECLGIGASRLRLLETAAKVAPDYAPARWHQGEIWFQGRWTPIDRYVESTKQRRVRESYERQRDRADDTVAGQLAMADWCRERTLPLQEVAHLNRVIQLEPNHLAARQRLGHRRVNGQWLATGGFWQGMTDQLRVQASIQKWRESLLQLAATTDQSGSVRLAAMREKLLADLTADAIPAIEVVLGTHSEQAALMAVEILGGMAVCDSSRALARFAVLCRWSSVRDAACQQLQSRPFDQYVPLLLAELSTPVHSRIQAAQVNGHLLYLTRIIHEDQA